MKHVLLAFSMLTAIYVAGCTANAPDEGVCKRTCGSRPVGGGKIRGVALNPKVTFSKCSAGQELPQQTFRYLIYDDTSTGTTTTDTSTTVPSRIPKAGMSFDTSLSR